MFALDKFQYNTAGCHQWLLRCQNVNSYGAWAALEDTDMFTVTTGPKQSRNET